MSWKNTKNFLTKNENITFYSKLELISDSVYYQFVKELKPLIFFQIFSQKSTFIS